MSSSLAALANNLEALPLTQHLKKDYPNISDSLMRRKGVFPYSYFSSMDTLKETSLPSIDKFKNDLTGEDCSLDDYRHAEQAWLEYRCRIFGDYMLAYLKLDVYLLADVFETFRKVTLEQDDLDPIHFANCRFCRISQPSR